MALEPRDAIFSGALWTLAAAALILLSAPTVVVVILSFTDGLSLKFPPPGWSTRWYESLLTSRDLIQAAQTSLTLAAMTTAICAVLGTAAAIGITRSRTRLARALDAMFMSPMVLPAMAFGLALLLVMSVASVRPSLWALTVGHVVVCTPFVIRMAGASLQQLDHALIESAESLGASRLRILRTITLPLIARGVAAGSAVAFLSSFDHVPVSLFLSDPRTEVLPIRLWHILEASLDVRVAAVSGVMVAATLAGLLLVDAAFGLRPAKGGGR